MAINLYVRPDSLISNEQACFISEYQKWQQSSNELKRSMEKIFEELI